MSFYISTYGFKKDFAYTTQPALVPKAMKVRSRCDPHLKEMLLELKEEGGTPRPHIAELQN